MTLALNLTNHVTKPTRVTPTCKSTIDHIISNTPSRIMHTDVLPCLSICNHDVPYAIINIRVTRFAPRYKYIRSEKNLDNELFKQDFASLPLHFVYGFDSPDDMVDALNSLIKESIERHAPLRRVKVTCPPAPWLADLLIRDLQQKRDKLRKKAHETNDSDDWKEFRSVQNHLRR